VIQASLLLPGVCGDLTAASNLSQRATASGKEPRDEAILQYTKGLVAYRQGHYVDAAECAERAVHGFGQTGKPGVEQAQAYMLMALARQGAKESAAAREALAKGSDLIATKLHQIGSPDLGPDWMEILTAHVLQKEAKSVIEGASVPPP
jgi:hypothetical protein